MERNRSPWSNKMVASAPDRMKAGSHAMPVISQGKGVSCRLDFPTRVLRQAELSNAAGLTSLFRALAITPSRYNSLSVGGNKEARDLHGRLNEAQVGKVNSTQLNH